MPQFWSSICLAFHFIVAVSATGYPAFREGFLKRIDFLNALRLPRQLGNLLHLFLGEFEAMGLFGSGGSARGIAVRGWEVESGSRFGGEDLISC